MQKQVHYYKCDLKVQRICKMCQTVQVGNQDLVAGLFSMYIMIQMWPCSPWWHWCTNPPHSMLIPGQCLCKSGGNFSRACCQSYRQTPHHFTVLWSGPIWSKMPPIGISLLNTDAATLGFLLSIVFKPGVKCVFQSLRIYFRMPTFKILILSSLPALVGESLRSVYRWVFLNFL